MISVFLILSVSADELLTQSQLNLQRPTTKFHRKLPGAFNPALSAFDPNSPEYNHKDPGLAAGSGTTGTISEIPNPADYGAPSDWIQCPPDVEGHRASYDCTAYIMCNNGELSGEYLSCMGLKFDNEKGVCDWGEDVKCGSDSNGSNEEGSSSEGGGGGATYSGEMESATAFRPMDGSWQSDAASSGEQEEPAAWNGGSDWGGSWVEGVW